MKMLKTALFILLCASISAHGQINVGGLKNKANKVKSEADKKKSENNTTSDEEEVKSDSQQAGSGRIYYVSRASGSNKNDGSKANPLKNIDKAIELAQKGDKIYIAEGTYSGKFGVGFLHSEKPLQLYGSWDNAFTEQDIQSHPTLFQPDNASGAKSRKPLLQFSKDVDGTVIDGIVWDMGERNLYGQKNQIEGLGGQLLIPPKKYDDYSTTVEQPCISILSKATGGDVTIQNCVFLNGANFGIQAGHRSGSFKILNNVFVANRMAAIEVYGTCAGSNKQQDMISCGDVEIAHNTILFTWTRLNDFMDMGYGIRIMTKARYNIHHNIIGGNMGAAVENNRFCKDEYIKIDNNVFFGNRHADLEYAMASNTKLKLFVAEFEDLEFDSVSGNSAKTPGIKVNQTYLENFLSAKYSETTSYDPNSPQNQWARVLGLNQQGTMSSSATMWMNKYPLGDALMLFGGAPGVGAQ